MSKSRVLARSNQVADKTKALPTSQILHTFMNAESLDEMRSAVKQADERLVLTWASVEGRDRHGERIPIEKVIEQQDVLLERGAPIQDNHTNRNVGRTLAYRVFEHPETESLGVLHLNKIYSHYRIDDKVWNETVSGERKGSSVGGTVDPTSPVSYQKEEDGELTPVLDTFEHHETSSVFQPANPWATNEAVSVVAKAASDQDIESPASHAAKSDGDETQKTKGETNMTENQEELNKKLDTLTEMVSKNSEAVAQLAESHKQLVAQKADDEKPSKEEDEEDEESEKKKQAVRKEEAASEIEGEDGKESPEEPHQDSPNDMDSMKELREEIKSLKEALKSHAEPSDKQKSTTPRPGQQASNSSNAPSVQDIRKSAVEIALGKKRSSWGAVHKMVRDLDNEHSKKLQELARTPVA